MVFPIDDCHVVGRSKNAGILSCQSEIVNSRTADMMALSNPCRLDGVDTPDGNEILEMSGECNRSFEAIQARENLSTALHVVKQSDNTIQFPIDERSRDYGSDYNMDSRHYNETGTLTGRFEKACAISEEYFANNACTRLETSTSDLSDCESSDLDQNGLLSCASELPNTLFSQNSICHGSWSSKPGIHRVSSGEDLSDGAVDDQRLQYSCSETNSDVAEDQTDMSVSETESTSYSPCINSEHFIKTMEDSASQKTVRNSEKEKSSEESLGDFDVFNIEATLPYMNWDYLEEQLQKAIEKEQQTQRNDREEIRRKLAMGFDDDRHFSNRLFKKPSLQMRHHSASSLQVCFVNELSKESDVMTDSVESHKSLLSAVKVHLDNKSESSKTQSPAASLGSSKTSLHPASGPAGSSNHHDGLKEMDFFTRQARLQAEARLALAQVRPMAHMQLQLEKQQRRKSPIADIVSHVSLFRLWKITDGIHQDQRPSPLHCSV
jgi:hypothetical protein